MNLPPRKKTRMDDKENKEEVADMDTHTLDRYSRQNSALGAETTAKLMKMRVAM